MTNTVDADSQAIKTNDPLDGATRTLLQLQHLQLSHDRKYHPDILSLSVHDRMKHMTLHFAKYVGLVATAVDSSNEQLERALTDGFIIALASANTLCLDLGKVTHAGSAPIFELGLQWSSEFEGKLASNEALLMAYARWTGRMAKACESLDHLEAGDFRSQLAECVASLTRIIATASVARGINLEEKRRQRIEQVERRSFFAPFYGELEQNVLLEH